MPKLASVLLVDDDATALFLHQLLLSRLGVAEQLLVAANGAAALAQLQQGVAPALILLDLNMPVLNGLGFLEAYQQLPPAQRQAPVVLLTTSANPRDLARAAMFSVASILTKPLTEEKIRPVLQRHFPGLLLGA